MCLEWDLTHIYINMFEILLFPPVLPLKDPRCGPWWGQREVRRRRKLNFPRSVLNIKISSQSLSSCGGCRKGLGSLHLSLPKVACFTFKSDEVSKSFTSNEFCCKFYFAWNLINGPKTFHCDLSKWIINQERRFVREGTSVSYKRYNMTTAWLGITSTKTVGVLSAQLPSFIAPLKVNTEHSNGPLVLIKASRFSSLEVASSLRVPLSLVHGLLSHVRILLCQYFIGWLIRERQIHKQKQYEITIILVFAAVLSAGVGVG